MMRKREMVTWNLIFGRFLTVKKFRARISSCFIWKKNNTHVYSPYFRYFRTAVLVIINFEFSSQWINIHDRTSINEILLSNPSTSSIFRSVHLVCNSFIKINNYEKVTLVFNHTHTLFISYINTPVFDK